VKLRIRKSRWERLLDTVNPLDGTDSIPSSLQKLGSEWREAVPETAVRTAGLIATGLVGLTAGSAGISSYRRRKEGTRRGS
jgi:hypothetical protein